MLVLLEGAEKEEKQEGKLGASRSVSQRIAEIALCPSKTGGRPDSLREILTLTT